MSENLIIYTLYFTLMAIGLWLAGYPFFSRKTYPLAGRLFRGIIITGHFFILIILIISSLQPLQDPQDIGKALAWLYGLAGHAFLVFLSLIVRLLEKIKMNS